MFKKPFTQSYNAPFEPGTIQDRFQMAKINLITKKKEKRKGAGYNMNYEPTMFIFFYKYQQINVWPFYT
jgi:non-homologous end joining protein Ku